MKKDLLSLWDLEKSEILNFIDEALHDKRQPDCSRPLLGKSLALLFEKASTRTKVSFSVAAQQLGAGVVALEQEHSQLGRGETYADTARVLSQYVDGIVLRTYAQERLIEMATHASIPVINGLSDLYHPCQVLADLMTVQEVKGPLHALKIAWIGDGNNMTHTWMVAAARLGFELRIATPPGREVDAQLLQDVRRHNAQIHVVADAESAVRGIDAINVDTWESMGQETQGDVHSVFLPYQLNAELLRAAGPQAMVLHCLPAHRGDEITNEVMDGPQSYVWVEAGNRLPMQRVLLRHYLTHS